MKTVIDAIIKYRLHVAFLAFSISMTAFARYQQIMPDTFLISLGFMAGFAFIYLYNKSTDLREDSVNEKSYPISPAHVKRVAALAWICLLLPVAIFAFRPMLLAFYLVLVFGLGFFYSHAVRLRGKKYRFKDIFILKNVVSGIGWGALAGFLPAVYNGTPVHTYDWNVFVSTFFIVMAIEIVWDVRDREGDRQAGIKTIANTYSLLTAKLVAGLPLLAIFLYRFAELHEIYIAAYVASLMAVAFVNDRRDAYYYQLLVFIWLIANLAFLAYKLYG